MATDQSILYDEILKIYTIPVPNPSMRNFAIQLSSAYRKYAKDITTYGENKLAILGANTMRTILNQLDAPGNTAAFVAQIIEKSVIAFWNVSAFSLVPPPPGFSSQHTIIITPMSPGIIFSGVSAGILSGGSAAIQATAWATAMHLATKTVMTTHIGFDTTLPVPLPKTEPNKLII